MPMTSKPTSEKVQEERRIKELRDFQRSSPANRRCFDCNEMMPQYVCLDFNTFVCTACSGIHREFAHRVKSISMSKFTESEVKNMITYGGNEAAQKYWRNKHDPSFRPHGGSDGERTRNFIRLTYVDRKWVYESPRSSKKESKPEASSTKSSKSKKKSPPASSSDDDLFSSSSKPSKSASNGDDAGFATFGDFSAFEKDTNAPTESFADFGAFENASRTPTKKANDDFADFGDFSGSTASCNTADPAPKPAPAAPKPATSSGFGSFKLAPPPGTHLSSSSANATANASATASNDLMGLDTTAKSDDPFGFDAPVPPTADTSSSRHASGTPSPFDSFDLPASSSTPGSRSSSADLAPFGTTTAAAPSTSPFDAFGPPTTSSSPALDPFAAPTPAPVSASTGSVFDAFGDSADGFGDFTGSTSSSRTNSGVPPATAMSDPFSAKPEPVASKPAADPFAAFDEMEPSSNGATTSDFSATGAPQGQASQQSPANDPFGFANGGGSNGNGFPGAGPGQQQQQQFGNGGMANQAFGGFPGGMNGGNQFPQQQVMPPQAYNNQPMQPFQQQQQQQWYGQPQGYPGQQQMYPPGQQQYPGRFPPQAGLGGNPAGAPPATPAQKKTSAAAEINDPFASLNIGSSFGFQGSSSSQAASKPSPAPATTGSVAASSAGASTFSYNPVQAQRNASFSSYPAQNTAAFTNPNAFGDFGDFTSAPQTNNSAPAQNAPASSSANPFDMF